MGIMVPIARAILREHLFRPITGSMLLIGRQTVPLTVPEAKALLKEAGVPVRADFNPDKPGVLDTTTRIGKNLNYISDIGFFAMFSDAKIRTLDVTDYEGAEIIHDMHFPVPDELENSMDFIYNGSCLDNMFDASQAMKSTARMLKPDGRAFCMEMGTPHYGAYTMFSQAWFLDYCAINNFKDCKVYSCIFHPNDIWDGPYDAFVTDDYDTASTVFPHHLLQYLRKNRAIMTVTIMEKGADTTWDRMPIQWQYRPDHAVYRASFARFAAMPRPVMKLKRMTSYPILQTISKVRYIGSLDAVYGRRFHRSFGKRLVDVIINPAWAISLVTNRFLGFH